GVGGRGGGVEGYRGDLGPGGRLPALPLDDPVAGTEPERVLLAQDYVTAPPDGRAAAAAAVRARLESLPLDELLDPPAVAAVLGFGGGESPCLDRLGERGSPPRGRPLGRGPRGSRPAPGNLIQELGGRAGL